MAQEPPFSRAETAALDLVIHLNELTDATITELIQACRATLAKRTPRAHARPFNQAEAAGLDLIIYLDELEDAQVAALIEDLRVRLAARKPRKTEDATESTP